MDENSLEIIAFCPVDDYPIRMDDGFCRNCGCRDY